MGPKQVTFQPVFEFKACKDFQNCLNRWGSLESFPVAHNQASMVTSDNCLNETTVNGGYSTCLQAHLCD